MPDYDLGIIGAGPGGYVAAIRAAKLGLSTIVVERDEVGGICLNWGCIPSKALLRNAEVISLFRRAEEFGVSVGDMKLDYGKAFERSRKVVHRLTSGVKHLLKKNKVEVVKGAASLVDAHTIQVDAQTLSVAHTIVATGARPRTIPPLPLDEETVITYRQALEARDVPARVAVVGGGATGVEFATIYSSYGAQVTIVEMLPNLLPNEDEEISQYLERSLAGRGITIMTNAVVEGASSGKDGVKLTVSSKDGQKQVEVDRVLVAVGVQGNTEDLGLEKIGVRADRGYIQEDATMSTGVSDVYAIGDVTGKMLLAHVASAQGEMVVERLAGNESPGLDYTYMPRATYCNPQVTSVGLTEREAKERGLEYKVGKFPFAANGKAMALGETEGVVKLIVNAQGGEILGAHMVGHEVTEMLGEMSLANLLEGTTLEVGGMVHSHPTLSEALKEAALAADERAIHI